jgi:Fe-S cluster biosynthesis and repair protein YggX
MRLYTMEGYSLFTQATAPLWDDVANTAVERWAEKRTKLFSEAQIDLEEDESKARNMREQNRRNFEKVVFEARVRLESAVAESELVNAPALYRGLSLSDDQIDKMIKSGYVSHPRINSWTAKPYVANEFTRTGKKVILVAPSVRKGFVNKFNDSEYEVVRPPSSMKISKVYRAKDGVVVVLDEDEDLLGG